MDAVLEDVRAGKPLQAPPAAAAPAPAPTASAPAPATEHLNVNVKQVGGAKKADSQKTSTLDAVTKLIQKYNVTPQEAMVHAKLLSSVTIRKKGDAERILLINMVKLGNISQEDAVRHMEESCMTALDTTPQIMPKGVWLNKKAELLGRSKMRYFTLFKTQTPERPGQFRYFEDADADGNGITQKGFIDLRDVQQVTNDKEILLIVMNTGRIFELVSEREQEAALWSSFLRQELTDCGVELPDPHDQTAKAMATGTISDDAPPAAGVVDYSGMKRLKLLKLAKEADLDWKPVQKDAAGLRRLLQGAASSAGDGGAPPPVAAVSARAAAPPAPVAAAAAAPALAAADLEAQAQKEQRERDAHEELARVQEEVRAHKERVAAEKVVAAAAAAAAAPKMSSADQQARNIEESKANNPYLPLIAGRWKLCVDCFPYGVPLCKSDCEKIAD